MRINLIGQNLMEPAVHATRAGITIENVFPGIPTLIFNLPPELEAGEPPEARGLSRDQVRLMVSYVSTDKIFHTRFTRLPDYLHAGDVLVINTSGTLNAALNVTQPDGLSLELHLSTHLPGDLWVVELRQPSAEGTQPYYAGDPGMILALPGSGQATLLTPYRPDQRSAGMSNHGNVRLWIADIHFPLPPSRYLEEYGFPIRYKYVHDLWPNSYYQTVYMSEKGSAEMPSAGRAFTTRLMQTIQKKGIKIAPLLLHTGVASLEEHEPPYAEYYHIPFPTAQMVNTAKKNHGRIIAVGTTVVRALETVTDEAGYVHSSEGWTDTIITPERGIKAIDGLLTGLHEPRSTHLAMLAALAGIDHIQKTYREALEHRYLWHEFGDLHLILSE